MRPVRECDIETAYKLTSDICDVADELFKRGQWDPFHFEIIWYLDDKPYDISIDVALKPKEKTNG
jgi:hypothetical protein